MDALRPTAANAAVFAAVCVPTAMLFTGRCGVLYALAYAVAAAALVLAFGIVRTVLRVRAAKTRAPLVFDTIAVSHYCEFVRWLLDDLDVRYVERVDLGIVGRLVLGRTVPRLLCVQTGTELGDSFDIVCWLSGRFGAQSPRASALFAPALGNADGRAVTRMLQKEFGHAVQRYVYHYATRPPSRHVLLQLWGVEHASVPAWQRAAARALAPLLVAFVRRGLAVDTPPTTHDAVTQTIEKCLADIERRLTESSSRYVLGTATPSLVDYEFASLAAPLWMPSGYGGAQSFGDTKRVEMLARMPSDYTQEMARIAQRYSKAKAHVDYMYAKHRSGAAAAAVAADHE